MNDAYPLQNSADNDRSLNKLSRAITLSQGNFALILVRCNYGDLRHQVVEQVKEICPVAIRERHLSTSIRTLYSILTDELTDPLPEALMIFGLDQVEAIEQVLISTNQVREEFRKNFPFPIVLWVNDETLKRIINLMPDFKSWTGNSIKFELDSDKLVSTLSPIVDQWVESILMVGDGKFLSLVMLDSRRAQRVVELESALIDLPTDTDRRLRAKLMFLAGRDADLRGDKSKARSAYEDSEALWKTLDGDGKELIHWGCVQLHLGLWWRQYAIQNRSEYDAACLTAKQYYQQAIGAFDQALQPALSSKFINALGEVLVRLGDWAELELVAPRIVALHEVHSDPIRRAYGYGLLAELALEKKDWTVAQQQAQHALETNKAPVESEFDWELDRQQRNNMYLRLLAKAQFQLGEQAAALKNLETARKNSDSQYNSLEYIQILQALRSLYFEKGDYLQAFETKQELRSVEQQYGLRAFVGAGRLQSRRQVVNPGLATIDARTLVTAEIAASGRSVDVDRLVERLGRTDHKLTVIYGQSGVGKSSLVQAGLLPALKLKSIDARDVVPVLLQVYADWKQSLNHQFTKSMDEVGGLDMPLLQDSMTEFVAEIMRGGDKNLLTVLIFDQFEEFFFAYKDPVQRRPFFEFLRDCLNVPYVKVILSLREDYLHYLLECNRLTHLDMISNNILDKNILYYLGNFSPKDAESVITSLTEGSQFPLEDDLVDELVRDLAGTMNEVRPIELQVVGAQMQTEKLTTLQQYLDSGPKEKLVGRFLEEVVRDCGTNNESFTKIILYLLTDDNLTRPLKTRAELEAELDIPSDRLSLILNILVKSGLIFQIPGFPSDRYQLVHDYLVPFVRQQQAAGMVAELEKEREQRKLTEARLNKVLTQQLKTSKRATLTLAGFVVAIGGVAIAATVAGINLYIVNLVSESVKTQQLDRLLYAIKAGKILKALPVAVFEIKLPALTQLNEAIMNTSELNRLEGHTSAVTQVVFSPNGQFIASISDDKTAKVWRVDDGKLLATLEGSSDKKITSVSFSTDSQKIAYAGEDQKIRFWTTDGKSLRVLETQGTASSLSFSPDDKLIATSVGKEVTLWDLSTGEAINTFKDHTGAVTSVNFSPDGKAIASADQDDTVKLWSIDERKVLKTISNYGTVGIRFSSDGEMLIMTNKDRSIKYYALDGTLVKTVSMGSRYGENTTTAAALSPDSKLLVSANRYSSAIDLNPENEGYVEPLSGHTDRITYLSFSPSGRIFASASQDKTIRLWKFDTKTLSSQSDQENKIKKIEFSPNSRTIATALADKTVQLLDKQGHLQNTLKGDGSMFSFSPDGQTILTKSAEDVIKIWSLGKPETSLKGNLNGISDVGITPNGKTVVSVGYDNTVRFWQDGRQIQTQSENNQKISHIIFSPDSQFVALTEKNRVQLWRSNGERIGYLPGNVNEIKTAIFSPDSELIATTGDSNLINLSSKDGTLIHVLKGHTDKIDSITFSPNSQFIISVSYSENSDRKVIKLWDRYGKLVTTLDGRSVKEVKFSPNNRMIAAINRDKTIQVWDIEGKQIANLSHNGEVTNLSFSPDGELLVSSSADNTNRLWSMDGTLIQTLRSHSRPVSQVAFNPADGKTIVSVSEDGMVQLWRKNGAKLKVFQKSSDDKDDRSYQNKMEVEFSKDGKKIILKGSKYDLKSKKIIYTLKIWDDNGSKVKEVISLNPINFSADGNTIIMIDPDKSLKLWDLNGSLKATLSGHQDFVKSAIFSPDGKIIASASDDHTVRLWSRDGRSLKKLDHADKVNSVSFSADSKVLASSSDDSTVKLWNKEGEFLKSLNHSDKVNMVSFSPTGMFLASASDDKTVKFWSQEGQQIKSPLEHTDKVNDIKFSRDGKVLVSVTQGNSSTLWQVSDGKKLIKAIENSNLAVFDPNSRILATASSERYSLSVRFSILNGMWEPGTSLSTSEEMTTDLQFSPDQTILATVSNKLSIVDFEVDRVLVKACSLARNYLKNNQKVKEDDRKLCDDVLTQK